MRSGTPRNVRVMSVRWGVSLFVTAMFMSIALMVWGLGRMLQSLFD